MTKSARFHGSKEPTSCARLRLAAALMVEATIASAGNIRMYSAASAMMKGIEAVGDDPGLKSDAITGAKPASIIARAFGYSVRLSAKTDAGRRTGCTPADFNAAMPSVSTHSK